MPGKKKVIKKHIPRGKITTQKRRGSFIKKGDPLPGAKAFKFDSSHTSDNASVKRTDELLENPKTLVVREVNIPKQTALFVKRRDPGISRSVKRGLR